MISVNTSVLTVTTTALRQDKAYVRDYTLIANTLCVLLLPTLVMLVSTVLIVREMFRRQRPTALVYTSEQEMARKKRNRSITLMLIGIIVLFFVCHIGEVLISLYEMFLYLESGGKPVEFTDLVRNFIVVNHLLIVVNSSLNFVIYCKDLVFRQTVYKTFHRWGRRTNANNNVNSTTAHNKSRNLRMAKKGGYTTGVTQVQETENKKLLPARTDVSNYANHHPSDISKLERDGDDDDDDQGGVVGGAEFVHDSVIAQNHTD